MFYIIKMALFASALLPNILSPENFTNINNDDK